MRTNGKILLTLTAFLLIPALFLAPAHTGTQKHLVKPDLYIYSADLNITEVGLPYGSSWGFSITDLNNSSNNQGQYGGSPQHFSTYFDIYMLKPGNYSIQSIYALDNSNTLFYGTAVNYKLASGSNHVYIHFYEVNVSTEGLPLNSSLVLELGPYSIEQTMPVHRFSVYMPNGTYNIYSGAKNYYSWNGLSFTINGSSANAIISFVKCYRITFNWESQTGNALNLSEGSHVVEGLLKFTAYEGLQINSTCITYMVPNGTYNITVIPARSTIRTNDGVSVYMEQVNLQSRQITELNVTGTPENFDISFHVAYTPLNLPAKIYAYSPEIAVLAIASFVLLYLAFFRNRRR